ncbi:MAG: GNAT family N-acetyltransferase [Nocardioides sp.]
MTHPTEVPVEPAFGLSPDEAQAAAIEVLAPPPRHWEADVLLRDGRTAHIRPIRAEDADLMVEFYARVSDQSKYFRFFAPMPELSDKDVYRFTHVDHVERVALIMLVGGQMIAVGRYDTITPGEAEVAFLVEDAHQGRGIGQLLLEHLAQAGRERGVERFTAEVLPENQAMIHTFRDAGYRIASGYEDGVMVLSSPSPRPRPRSG